MKCGEFLSGKAEVQRTVERTKFSRNYNIKTALK